MFYLSRLLHSDINLNDQHSPLRLSLGVGNMGCIVGNGRTPKAVADRDIDKCLEASDLTGLMQIKSIHGAIVFEQYM
jgi:hypothetical protein